MPDRIEHLQRLLRERIVIIDGAMGTMIQQHKLDEAAFRGARFADWHGKDLKGLNDLLNVTRPQVIEEIHRQYLEAGADIIETNTFNSQSHLARGLRDGVAGLRTFESGRGMCAPRGGCGREGATGPDLFCRRRHRADDENIFHFDGREQSRRARHALTTNWSRLTANRSTACSTAARICCWWKRFSTRSTRGPPSSPFKRFLMSGEFSCSRQGGQSPACRWKSNFDRRARKSRPTKRIPILASVTFIQAGSNRGVTGQTVEAFWNSISNVPLLSVGMNCALGPKELRPLIEELSGIAPIYVSAYPNAGLPNPLLPTGFPETPETLAPQLARMGAKRLAQHRRRLLRHDAAAHQGDCRGGQRFAAAQSSDG